MLRQTSVYHHTTTTGKNHDAYPRCTGRATNRETWVDDLSSNRLSSEMNVTTSKPSVGLTNYGDFSTTLWINCGGNNPTAICT